MKNKIKSIIIFLIILSITFSNISYGISTNEEKIDVTSQKSEAYKKWEQLSEEERKDSIEPSYNSYNLKDTIKRSTLNKLLASNESIESRFDLRTILQNNINVKNQKHTNSCWAFSYTSALETTLANKYNRKGITYSPLHIDYKTSEMFNKKVGDGGNYYLATAYAVSGYGPVYESDFPFENVYDEENNSRENYYLTSKENVDLNKITRARVKDVTYFPGIYKSYETDSITYRDQYSYYGATTYSNDEVEAIRNLIKKSIKKNGAVAATFYSDSAALIHEDGTYSSNYYNNDTKAFYCNSVFGANHAVTIVGWDDNFKKENFAEGKRPLNDGAYIVLNSWGANFGENGYFYVSYDDAVVEQSICGINEIERIEETDYDNLYENDELGMTVYLYAINKQGTDYLDNIYLANSFTRENSSDKHEYLSEIGLFLGTTEGVEIYVNPNDDDLTEGTLVATYTGSNALEAGYHTIKLPSPILLTGQKFSIKAKYINSEKVTMPLECNLTESGLTERDNIFTTVKSNIGESYVSEDGNNWEDLTGYSYGGQYTLKDTNACIKAFSSYSDTNVEIPVTGIELNKTNETVEVGNTINLIATVKPENATNKNISWNSEDESIARVENGVVTGISEGTTTITVSTVDGNYSNQCQVTVVKQEAQVTNISVTGIELDKSEITIKVGETDTLVATITPTNATNKNIVWKSDNEKIAKVENGIITGISEGTTTITVSTVDGNYSKECIVTIENNENFVQVTGISLNKSTHSMQVGEKGNLVATITPTNATNKNIIWTSSNESVATISSTGIIEAIKEGVTTISATTENGQYTAICEVTVTKKESSDDDIYTMKNTSQANINNNNSRTPSILPKTGTNIGIIIIISLLTVVAIVIYIKSKRYKGI